MRSNKHSLTKKSNYAENDYAPKTIRPKKEKEREEELDFDIDDNAVLPEDTKIATSTVKNIDYKNKYEQSLLQIEYLENLVAKLSQKQDENLIKRIEKIEVLQDKLSERLESIESRSETKEVKETKIPLPGNNKK